MNMKDCRPVDTPMVPGLNLPEPKNIKMTDEDKKLPYQKGMGLLIWCLMTRVDIAFAVGVLCRYMSSYDGNIFSLMKRVLRYLKGTSSLGLEYKRSGKSLRFGSTKEPIDLVMYGDADNASRVYDSKSTTGWLAILAKGVLCFKSTIQRSIALSTVESEFLSLKDACQEVEWLRALLQEIGVVIRGPTVVKQDNQSTIKLALNPVMHTRTKHFRVSQHYVRKIIVDGVIIPKYQFTDEMLADITNKALSGGHFIRTRNQLMVGSK